MHNLTTLLTLQFAIQTLSEATNTKIEKSSFLRKIAKLTKFAKLREMARWRKREPEVPELIECLT